ncbi:Exodeoxyribonuclease V gamma chain [Mannheimia haemolytica]|uniref:Exodeoxyribonuclease V gamma chain n=1 Tax=Mannheimia haemolytica TaxID=75985 RepID=A0A378MXC0_MANHA|nr:Exodeoxyribonuclease V gamma chain [Mannheimia haemolytica]
MGKQGRDFLAQLIEFEPNTMDVFVEPEENSNLNKLKKQIFSLENDATITDLTADNSLQIHSCHSPMREVEVLHNQLLNLFEQDSTLLPKDIIVMSPDINKYAPYIDAVFSRYNTGNRILAIFLFHYPTKHLRRLIRLSTVFCNCWQ